MNTLYVLRHGETLENATGFFQGHRPGHLSDAGRRQAAEAATEVMSRKYDAVYCSDLQRCKDTLDIVLRTAGAECDVVYTPLLRERDMGRLTGLPVAGAVIDDTVESFDQAAIRARQFIDWIASRHSGAQLLVVSHGYFLHVLQAVVEGKTYKQVARVHNCELRRLIVNDNNDNKELTTKQK